MKLYIDITNILEVSFFTGIPRVVSEVTLRMIQAGRDVTLLAYSVPQQCYRVVDNARYCQVLLGKEADKQSCYTDKLLKVSEMEHGAVFFDMNSTWHTLPQRNWLLPELKNMQLRIAVLLYDLIPITHPQFLPAQTRQRFMSWLLAHLKYADQIFVNSKSVANDVAALYDALRLPAKPCMVVPLGATFSVQTGDNDQSIDETAKQIVAAGSYVLVVGSLEPRKNHKLIFDAYEKLGGGVQLVFAGRANPGSEKLISRMQAHPNYGKQLFHLQGVNDATIDYLYQHAFLVVFASLAEGYGLPTVEAMLHGVPVIASDIPIMREIGGAYCDYCKSDDAAGLAKLIQHYLKDSAAYAKKRELLKQYQPPDWSKTEQMFSEKLLENKTPSFPHKPIRQIVFLSARPEPFLETIPFVEHFMAFLEEVVVCCPARMAEQLRETYHGRLKLTTITDDELLGDRELPADHTMRNFLLRCMIMHQDAIDDEFIMSDDDYRPLCPISEEVFYKDDCYQVYYFADIAKWNYIVTRLFSYDYSLFRTLSFLRERGYPTLQYSGHQPQIINKVWYLDMLREDESIMTKGLDEWSSFFNYCAFRHPNQIKTCPYVTLSWPIAGGCWELAVQQPQYLFENFYWENYKTGQIFDGLSRTFHAEIAADNQKKIAVVNEQHKKHFEAFGVANTFAEEYYDVHGELPTIALICPDDSVPLVSVPEQLALKAEWHNILRIGIARDPNTICNAKNMELLCELLSEEWDSEPLETYHIPILPRQTNTGFDVVPPRGERHLFLRVSCVVRDMGWHTPQLMIAIKLL